MKFILTLLFSFLMLSATEMGLKGGSCTLAQEGKVSVYYNDNAYKNVSYKANAKSGKNFREIFIGSVITLSNTVKMQISDYVPNKRVKGKPKTGLFIVDTTINGKATTIQMAYIFDKGIMSATGVVGKTTIGFATKVNYSLCSVKIK